MLAYAILKIEMTEHRWETTLERGGTISLIGRFNLFELGDAEKRLIALIADAIYEYTKTKAAQ
jgi:hypothetical protein